MFTPIDFFNCSDRSMDLILGLEPCTGLAWCSVSGRQMGKLEPGKSLHLPLCIIPLATGLQVIMRIEYIITVFLIPFIHY